MRVENSPSALSATGWIAYATGIQNWQVPVGEGLKTVYVQFKDPHENLSAVYAGSITIDLTPPSFSSASPLGGLFPSTQTITFTTEAGSSIYIALAANSGAACPTPAADFSNYVASMALHFAGTADGQKVCYFAADPALNREATVSSQTYVVDTTLPVITATGNLVINQTGTTTLTWSGTKATLNGGAEDAYDIRI